MRKLKKEVFLAKKTDLILPLVLTTAILLIGLKPSFPADMTGSIRGTITDENKLPIPGAYLYLTSPAIIGVQNFITNDTGGYGFSRLPPGAYILMVEKPGFKTVTVENIVISAGATALVDVRLEATDIEEEPALAEVKSGLDRVTSANTFIVDSDLLVRLPAPRDLSRILGLIPGIVFDNDRPGEYAAVHGGTVTDNIIMIDPAVVTDPVIGAPMPRINLDAVEQVVVETAAHPAERGPVEGGYVNVLYQSGGNAWSGGLSIFHTNKNLNTTLFPAADLQEMGVLAPASDDRHWDLSLSGGGPVLKDIAWFFANLRHLSRHRTTPFVPWADPLSTMHWNYFWDDTNFSGLFKLSLRATPQYAGFIEYSFSRVDQPVYESDVAWNRPIASTRSLEREFFLLVRSGLNYSPDQRTNVYLSLGYAKFKQPLILNQMGSLQPQYFDIGTGYTWGSGSFNNVIKNARFIGSAVLTRLQENILGADHELKAGAEYEDMSARSSAWKFNNLLMSYSFGDPYFYGQAVSPESGNTVGLGLIGFSVLPRAQDSLNSKQELKRLGVFVQDSLTIAGRVALSLGFRFDRSDIRTSSLIKGTSGNPLSIIIAEELVQPTYDLNPFYQTVIPSWDSIITWNNVSPRAGLSIDLFGTGRTLAKASFAQYPEYLGLGYSQLLLPIQLERYHQFYWYDENEDVLMDEEDTYVMFPEDYRIYQEEFYQKRIDPGLKSPTTDEWTVGVEQEIRRGFFFSLRYISKTQKNIIGDVLYDPDTESPWYSEDGAQPGWWIPFQTTIPAVDAYPETPVTVYYPSLDAPPVFDRIQNVPELLRKYRAFELSLRKVWAGRWQFAGSVVFSRATGTAGLDPAWRSNPSASALSPNSFVNVTGASRLDLDRPLTIRLMGTARLPWEFFLSLYFRSSSGAPWARSVTIIPPESWVQDNGVNPVPVSVYLESPGSRRREAWNNLDLGIEKEFAYKNKSFLSLSLNVLNLLGNKVRFLDLNDGGLWYPTGESTPDGVRILSETYEKHLSVWGSRTIYLKLRLRF
jgi:hypothetical protein